MGYKEELLPNYNSNAQRHKLWVKQVWFQILALPLSCLVVLGDIINSCKLGFLIHTNGTLQAGGFPQLLLATECALKHVCSYSPLSTALSMSNSAIYYQASQSFRHIMPVSQCLAQLLTPLTATAHGLIIHSSTALCFLSSSGFESFSPSCKYQLQLS